MKEGQQARNRSLPEMRTPGIVEDFTSWPGPGWQIMARGQGTVASTGSSLLLATKDAMARAYSNAQVDDYENRSRHDFLWRPPLVFSVRARFSHTQSNLAPRTSPALLGTAGFGFWNDPFLMTGLRSPALPRAIWFFYASPPSNMKLDLETPGWGWKAATIDAARWQAAALLVLAPLAVPLFNVAAFYRRVWPRAQRILRICEASLGVPMDAWHTYVIEWNVASCRFLVDGTVVLTSSTAPKGPLGLVLWIDNQYLVATPWGTLRSGLLDIGGTQGLELADLRIG